MNVTTLEGKEIPFASLVGRGNPLVLEFWATWCLPCRITMPHLNELRKEYSEEQVGIVALNIQDPKKSGDTVRRFSKRMTVQTAFAPLALSDFMNVHAVPTVLVFDANGSLVTMISGVSRYRTLKGAVASALSDR